MTAAALLSDVRPRSIAFPAAIAADVISSDTSGLPRLELVSIHQRNRAKYGPAANLPDGRFRIVECLADYARHDGSDIYPDVERLAREARKSVGFVKHVIRELKRRGWLEEYIGTASTRRWRLQLPCGNAVENAVEGSSGNDPRIAFDDRRIAIGDPRIVPSPDLTLPFDNELTDAGEGPSSFLTSLVRPEHQEPPALIAPAPPSNAENQFSTPEGAVPSTVRSGAARAAGGADAGHGRVEGAHQRPHQPGRLPDTMERAGVPRDDGNPTRASDVAPGNADGSRNASPGGDPGGGRREVLVAEASASEVSESGVHRGAGRPDDDPRSRTIDDVQAFLKNLKATLDTAAPPARRRR